MRLVTRAVAAKRAAGLARRKRRVARGAVQLDFRPIFHAASEASGGGLKLAWERNLGPGLRRGLCTVGVVRAATQGIASSASFSIGPCRRTRPFSSRTKWSGVLHCFKPRCVGVSRETSRPSVSGLGLKLLPPASILVLQRPLILATDSIKYGLTFFVAVITQWVEVLLECPRKQHRILGEECLLHGQHNAPLSVPTLPHAVEVSECPPSPDLVHRLRYALTSVKLRSSAKAWRSDATTNSLQAVTEPACFLPDPASN
ncbi:hypothetical protein MRB53_036966 [Persea americana]|nr:hypothetical protein MRB53_036966 [Persea americana]